MASDESFCMGFGIGAIITVVTFALVYAPTWNARSLQRCIEKPEWCEVEMPRMHKAIQAAQSERENA